MNRMTEILFPWNNPFEISIILETIVPLSLLSKRIVAQAFVSLSMAAIKVASESLNGSNIHTYNVHICVCERHRKNI